MILHEEEIEAMIIEAKKSMNRKTERRKLKMIQVESILYSVESIIYNWLHYQGNVTEIEDYMY